MDTSLAPSQRTTTAIQHVDARFFFFFFHETLRLRGASAAAAGSGRSQSRGPTSHPTGARLAHQAAAAWSRLRARSWRRLAAGQPTAHSTSGAPTPGLQRRARVVRRVGHEAGVGYGGTAGTRRSSGPRLLQCGLRVVEALRGSTPGSARLCVGAPRQARPPPGAASASRGGDESCVAAQSFAVARCSVDNEVEAATVAEVLPDRPLRERPGPTPSQRRNHAWAAGRSVGRRGGGPVCIDLGPTAVSAFRATVQGCEGQGQPKAAPHCDVHEVGRKGGGCVRRNCRKPHTSVRTGLRVKEGASGRSHGRKQHAFSKGATGARRPLRSARPALCSNLARRLRCCT